MSHDPLPLNNLIQRVADGEPLDWEALAAQTDARDHELLGHLRLVASVAEAHRGAGNETPLSADDSLDAPGIEELPAWRHLQLLEKIGEGAFGEVFRARDRWLDRDVALKLLKPSVAASANSSLLKEARTLARLRHPNVVAVYGADVHDGRIGLWMELVRGKTLAEIVATQGTFSAREAAVIGQEVCRALAAVHGAGIVHRDVKAQNVMRESGGRLLLMDFGAGGTPVYLAPEVVEGGPQTIASDIYAVGVLLFHLVTGRFPLVGHTLPQISAAHRRGERSRLIDARADLPDEFVAAVERMLDSEAHRRFGSAGEVVSALIGQAVAVSRTSRRANDRSPSSRDGAIAVLPFVELSARKGLDYFCDGIAEEIISALSAVPDVRVVASTSAFKVASRSRDVRHIGSLLNVGTVLEGSVRSSGDRLRITARLVATSDATQIWSQRFDVVLDDIFAVQEQIANAAVQALGVNRSPVNTMATSIVPQSVRNVEAYTQYLKGRYCWNRRTEATLQKSVDYFLAALDKEPDYVEALAGLAEAYTTLGLYGVIAPREIMPKARSAAERAVAVAPGLPSPHATLGCLAAVYDWEWHVAEQHFQRAFELNPREPVARHWYAINYLVPLGRFAEARDELTRASDADPLSLAIRVSHGLARYFADEFAEAEREITQSLELDPGASTAHLFLGLTLVERGAYSDAVRAIETAQRLSPSPEMTAALGLALARSGDRDRAHACLAELQHVAARRYISPSLMSQVQLALGEASEALDLLERAVAMRAADLAWLAVRPVFRELRGKPRFERMLEVLGLSG